MYWMIVCGVFNKDSVLHGILPKIEEGLAKINKRGLPIVPHFQLLVALRYYASTVVGDSMQVAQATISRIVFRVCCLLASLIFEYINFPMNPRACKENRRLFCELGKGNGAIALPGVDRAIDCTHIRLVSTTLRNINEIFRNRKVYFSLNVQVVVGPQMQILDIVPQWPGSAHDSHIFQNFALYMRYTEGELDGMLIGDRGYPCLPFLTTALVNPQTDEELTYNNIQSRTRQIVERTFGIWKRRFACLSRGLGTKLLCSTSIIVACAVLHNMSLIFKDVLLEDDDEFVDDAEVPVHAAQGVQDINGFVAREALINRLFQ